MKLGRYHFLIKMPCKNKKTLSPRFHFFNLRYKQGLARTQIPTNTNYAVEFPTFGEIAGVNPTGVQWKGLALGEPPS